jgi:hypothetical protein
MKQATDKTSVDIQRTTQPYVPGNSSLHIHGCESFQSNSVTEIVIWLQVLFLTLSTLCLEGLNVFLHKYSMTT